MDRPQPDLIYFDIGGVLVTQRPDPQQFASILNLGNEPHVLTLIDHAIWAHRDAYDEGMTDKEFWNAVSGDCGLPEPSETELDELVTTDSRRMYGIDECAAYLLEELKAKGYTMGVLTNMPSPHASIVMESPWAHKYFNGPMIFSSYVGVAKPNRGIYREAIEAAQIEAERILFIDDREENTKAAEFLGISTLTWSNAHETRERLIELGIL